MLDLLKIIQKAIAKNPGHLIMTHFNIDAGKVTGTDSIIAIRANVPGLEDVTANINAGKLVTAISACATPPSIKVTAKNVVIKAGNFRAQLAKASDVFPSVAWGGDDVQGAEAVPQTLRLLRKFTGTNYPGVLINGTKAYATDNNAMVAVTLPHEMPQPFTLPEAAVDVLLSIKSTPTAMRLADNYAVFVYDDFEVRCSLLNIKWPDVDKFFQFTIKDLMPISDALVSAVNTIAKFTSSNNNMIDFTAGVVSAGDASMTDVDVPDACLNAETATNLLDIMTHADFSASPMRFIGENIIGVCAGAAKTK